MTLVLRTLTILVLILASVAAGSLSISPSDIAVLSLQARTIPRARAVAIRKVWGARAGPIRVSEIGRGKGIVFSPDLSEAGNREFYRALGFAYFEDSDWRSVLQQIREFNRMHPGDRIETLLIQSHGTNGDALKLQSSSQLEAPRSYIAAAGLLEALAGTGVRVCLLAACNAGRLFRPETYHSVKAADGNRLFEPATLGVINASPDFDPSQSGITIARRAESHIEVINECRLSEFSPATRSALLDSSSDTGLKTSTRIAVPEMLIQLALNDEQLHLVSEGFELEKSRAETNDNYRERLISRFLQFVNTVAARER